jgi:excinuclease ABC subunit C
MNQELKTKLSTLPTTPGVYFHKDTSGEVIYIGKAAVLRNRVRQYFQKSRTRDPKTDALVAEIFDTDWIEVETEIDALFLEAEMVRRYLPRYNILLRDDKSLSYVRIDMKSDYPTVSMTRRPLDDGADYFGPYINAYSVKKALKYLRRIFPYAVTRQEGTLGSKLYEQIGLDPGLNSGRTTIEEYRSNLKQLAQYLRGGRKTIMDQIEKEMKRAAKANEFEQAARLRNQLYELKALSKQIVFGDREFLDISKDKGLSGLSDLLGIDPPKRIEGYDISHMSGTDTVASMVVFRSGMPEKTSYRKFKMRLKGNNDFAHISEAITRRLGKANVASWGLPDLFLIDGGKGQLHAAIKARDAVSEELPYSKKIKAIPMIGLAKREEQIVIDRSELSVDTRNIQQRSVKLNGFITETNDFILINLPHSSDIVKLLQRIRDESHRFAVSYHSTLKRSRQTTSWLDEVPGIGPVTKKKLIRTFGSAKGVTLARMAELEKLVGVKQATILKQYIRAEKNNNEIIR